MNLSRSIAAAAVLSCVACSGPKVHVAPLASETRPVCSALRTLDPGDGDFTDLAPLEPMLEHAMVVALGEATHADGAAFTAKARLVRFLQARMGFRVLAWEASLFACESDPSQCLGWPWGETVETRAVRNAAKGLRITGIDPRPTGTDAIPRLKAFIVGHVSDPALRAKLDAAFERFPKPKKFRLLDPDTRSVDEGAFREVLASIQKLPPSADRDLAERAVQNVLDLYVWHAAVGADKTTDFDFDHQTSLNNERDRAMADNVRWLMEKRYPGEKIVLWVANSHAAKDVEIVDAKGTAYAGAFGGWRTMGAALAKALGPRYVAIATTAHSGQIGNPPIPVSALPAAPAGSVEDQCSDSTHPAALLLPSDEPRVGGFFGHQPFRAPWAHVFDAAVVIRTMAPAIHE